MDEIAEVIYEDFYLHNTQEVLGENAKQQSYIENVAAALAGLSFILNLFIIITVVDVKLKTHLKLVLSLAFSDLFLALLLVVTRFVRFPSPWVPFLDLTLIAELPYNITANTTELHFSIDTCNRLIPMYDGIPDAVKDLFVWEPPLGTNNGAFMSNETVAFNYDDKMDFQQKMLDSIRPSGFNGTERFRVENGISDSTLSIVLTCAYLIPNITSVLTMLCITLGLLVSVVRPLHYRIIWSKRRGTVLVLTIWGFALLYGVVFFVLTLNKDFFFELSIELFDARLFIWYGVAVCFLTISTMYVIIFIGIRRQITKQSTRALANKKAAITVIGSFAVFNLPVMWGIIFSPLNVDMKMLSVNFETILKLLFIANMILDPIIYAVRLDEVAAGVTKIKTKFQLFCTSKEENKK